MIDPNGNVFIDNSLLQKNTELEAKVAKLEQELAEIKRLLKQKDAPSTSISAELYQNVPNFFDKDTEIAFFIPQESNSTILFIYDWQGKQIQKIALNQRGKAQIKL